MLKPILIFLGSGLGGVLRYALGNWVQNLSGGKFPLGTLAVNVLGCLVIGLLSATLASRFPVREDYRLALVVGLLGGFTTFSSFGMETFALVDGGHYLHAAVNIALSVIVCLIAVWSGHRLAAYVL
jgi:fluoride exporter